MNNEINTITSSSQDDVLEVPENKENLINEESSLMRNLLNKGSSGDNTISGNLPLMVNSKKKGCVNVPFDLKYLTYHEKPDLQIKSIDRDVWMTQPEIAELFDKDKDTISLHLQNLLTSGEVSNENNIRILPTKVSRGRTYESQHYNLDAIILVGFKVNSTKAAEFRKWAVEHLKSVILKGYTLEESVIKDKNDIQREILRAVAKIRASESSTWRQLTDSLKRATDYKGDTQYTGMLISGLQNKLHYAVHGHTASELIVARADYTKERMGLRSLKKRIVTMDGVDTAKNYMSEDELQTMEDISETIIVINNLADRKQPVYTVDEWLDRFHSVLSTTKQEILYRRSTVSRTSAVNIAGGHLLKYRERLMDIPGNSHHYINCPPISIAKLVRFNKIFISGLIGRNRVYVAEVVHELIRACFRSYDRNRDIHTAAFRRRVLESEILVQFPELDFNDVRYVELLEELVSRVIEVCNYALRNVLDMESRSLYVTHLDDDVLIIHVEYKDDEDYLM